LVKDLFEIATSEDSLLDLSARTEQGQRVKLGALLKYHEGRVYTIDDDLQVRVARGPTSGERLVGGSCV
jgi:hypothetical protein